MQGIYVILNLVDKKAYVGQAKNIKGRWKGHVANLQKSTHGNSHLQNAWNKYKEENFEFIVLERVNDESNLTIREKYWMDNVYKSRKRKYGYNIKEAGVHGSIAEETKQKISIGNSGINHRSSTFTKNDVLNIVSLIKSGETCLSISKMYNVGKRVILKIKNGTTYSNITSGAILDSEIDLDNLKKNQFNYMSSVMTGKCAGEKNGMYKRSHTKEARSKMSEDKKGKSFYDSSKLNKDQVLEIVDLLKERKIMGKEIAKMYNISPQVISAIRNGRSYVKYTGGPLEIIKNGRE